MMTVIGRSVAQRSSRRSTGIQLSLLAKRYYIGAFVVLQSLVSLSFALPDSPTAAGADIFPVRTIDDQASPRESANRMFDDVTEDESNDSDEEEDYELPDAMASDSRPSVSARQIASRRQRTDTAGTSDSSWLNSRDHDVSADGNAGSEQQSNFPRWLRSGVSKVVVYVSGGDNSSGDGNGSMARDGGPKTTTSRNLAVDTWRSRMRRKYARLYGILKDVNDFIGPGGRHRTATATSSSRTTTVAPLSAPTKSRQSSSRCPNSDALASEQNRRAQNDTASDSPNRGGNAKNIIRHTGNRQQQQQPVDCRNTDVGKKTSATPVGRNVKNNILIMPSSCARHNDNATEDTDVVGVKTAGSTAQRRKKLGAGAWLKFQTPPTVHCCHSTVGSRQRNETTSFSTRIALYKRATTSMNSDRNNTKQHRGRRMTSRKSTDDIRGKVLSVTVYQRRNGYDSDVELIGSHEVEESFDGWIFVQLTDNMKTAVKIKSLCHRANRSAQVGEDPIELLVWVAGNRTVDDEQGHSNVRRRQLRRHRTKDLNVRDIFRVPSDCRSVDDASPDVGQRHRRRSSSEKRGGRATGNVGLCGKGADVTRRQYQLSTASVPQSQWPFIELTASSNVNRVNDGDKQRGAHPRRRSRQ